MKHMSANVWGIIALSLLPLACSDGEDPPGGGPQAAGMTELMVGKRPESVTKGWDGKLYVSVQNETDVALDDGEIKVVDGSNVSTFASGLKEPKGIAFTGTHLVMTDLNRVWIIDRAGSKRILAEAASFPFPAAYFNDTAAEAGGQTVLVTEMGQRGKMRNPMTMDLWPLNSPEAGMIMPEARVYRIAVADGKASVAVDATADLLIANGVTSPGSGRLLMAEFFLGNVLELTGTTMRKLATGYRGGDGIEQDADGSIYISSFEQGKVWKLDRNGQNEKVLLEGRGARTTADFYLDKEGKRLIIPDTAKGTLIFLPLS